MKKTKYLSLIMILFAGIIQAQNKPTYIIKSEPVIKVPSLASRKYLPSPPVKKGEMNKKRLTGQNIIVPGKGFPKGNDPLLKTNANNNVRHSQALPDLTFVAHNHDLNSAPPTDPTGAVGPNHYVVAFNTGFKIFDKNGNTLINDTSLDAIFPGSNNDGDPIVLYDRFADRYIITEFDLPNSLNQPYKLMIAVSQGPDPVNDGWYEYRFQVNSMPDYPKYSIWSDGYYITLNKDNPTQDQVVYALERDKILAGDNTAQMIGFNLPGIIIDHFYSPSGFNILGNQLPPHGNAPIVYFQDDSWAGVNDDHLKIWNINVDWNTPSNSTISNPQIINTTSFNSVFNNGSFSNLMQPNGIKIDALQATVMFMTNYRRFTNYNSVVLNFVVKGTNDKAAIRWYELHQNSDGDPWVIYQEGTFADPTGNNTFAGSISMDKFGNIALGYTIVGANQPPELRYTGRVFNDPIGQFTITPQSIAPGVQSSDVYRYGDYSQLTVDPTDDKTFWFIGEYFNNNFRVDQVGAFSFVNYNNDISVTELVSPTSSILGNSESITVKIQNLGSQPASNFQVSYQIDGGNTITENYIGTIAPGTSSNYTFNTTADLSNVGHTYQIVASVNLQNDQDHSNDALTVNVTSVYHNDVGISNIVAPVSSDILGNSEQITVTIKNFGGNTQTNIPVSYTLDGNVPVNEIFTGNLGAGSEVNYTFNTTGNFSVPGIHHLIVKTNLNNDQDNSNDEHSADINKTICQPFSDCTDGDVISHLTFSNIDNNSSCGVNGYSDFTNIVGNLINGNTYPLTVTTNFSNDHFTVWIDFNDNFLFETNEKIIDNETIDISSGGGTYTKTINTNLPTTMPLGQHLMRAKLVWDENPDDPCANADFGETEDYTVNVTDAGSINQLNNANIILQSIGQNHYLLKLENVKSDDEYILKVYNVAGQELVHHYLIKNKNIFTYDLNLSYVSKGIYLIHINNNNKGSLLKRIIVR